MREQQKRDSKKQKTRIKEIWKSKSWKLKAQ
jgi:hypothetical protein